MVPDALRVDDGNWTLHAHAQTVRLCSVNQRFRADQPKLFQTFLQVIPRFQPLRFGSAFGFRLICAQKNVALVLIKPERFGG